MENWLKSFADALGVPSVSDEETDALLKLAREVAHGTDDRRLAPLATFLAGVNAAGAGGSRLEAIGAAVAAAKALLPEQGEGS